MDSVSILLVDDQPAKLLSYEAILSDLGEHLIKAHSAREALEHLLKHDVAVILVDVCMPDLDGFELVQLIREHPRYKHTAIIFVSAVMMTDFDRLRGYRSGAVDYVSVPVVPEILRAKVMVFADLYRKTKELETLNRELELRVAERTERLALALDSAGAASWDWDVHADRLEWTRFSRLYGMPKSRASTISAWLSCMDGEDRERVAARIEALKSRRGGDEWHETFRINHRGSVRVISRLGRALRDAEGEVVRITGIDLDVTQRVVAEQALKEADRRKDEFLATLAHELRNPLAPIRNALHLLDLDHAAPTQRVQWRQIIKRQVDHMVRLVDDLLDVSRISSGKIALRLENIELIEVVRRAVETCAPLAEAQGVSLSVDACEQSLLVQADLTRLVQVLSNIMHNAIKYTERGGDVHVVVSQDDRHVTIEVIDSGIGIPAEMLPRIFDLFTQVRGPDGGATSGLGIGLALARQLVQMHGGTLTASSAGTGKGSTFRIRLPPLRSASATPKLPAPSSSPPQVGKLRIVVADDNEDAADSLALLLEAGGHEVATVYDGPEAVAAAVELRPDVVVLDIGMPTFDGYEAARRIRTQPGGAAMFLIALTGWGQPGDRRKAAEAGFDLHLTKPVDPLKLEEVLADRPRTTAKV